jgi:hypothetical protein
MSKAGNNKDPFIERLLQHATNPRILELSKLAGEKTITIREYLREFNIKPEESEMGQTYSQVVEEAIDTLPRLEKQGYELPQKTINDIQRVKGLKQMYGQTLEELLEYRIPEEMIRKVAEGVGNARSQLYSEYVRLKNDHSNIKPSIRYKAKRFLNSMINSAIYIITFGRVVFEEKSFEDILKIRTNEVYKEGMQFLESSTPQVADGILTGYLAAKYVRTEFDKEYIKIRQELDDIARSLKDTKTGEAPK